jgi:uncharacterized protein
MRMSLVADCKVVIQGRPLDPREVASLLVRQDVSAPGAFELRLNTKTQAKAAAFLLDDQRFEVGSAVVIEMRYRGKWGRVLAGEITGLELESRSGEELLTVRGHDRGHRLLRGRKTRAFTQVKDSDIARQVAEAAGLFTQAEDTQVTLEYVLQHNQTDWDFLQQRARDLGFEIRVKDKTLLFRPHRNDRAEALTLLREGADLLELRLHLSTVGLVGQVTVKGWSSREKEAITGKASATDQGTLMGGRKRGLAVADDAFGAAVGTIVDRPVLSQAEADQIARGRLREMALAYITGEGSAIGRADLEAGTVVRIDGFGTRFSGLYYLASVCHTYLPKRGYRTTFTVRRNAS